MIGKIVKEMKWVMRMNESAETKGKCRHGKGISPKMSKNRGIGHSVREGMIKHNNKNHVIKEHDAYLTNTWRQRRTDPIAIKAHDSSSYGVMMV